MLAGEWRKGISASFAGNSCRLGAHPEHWCWLWGDPSCHLPQCGHFWVWRGAPAFCPGRWGPGSHSFLLEQAAVEGMIHGHSVGQHFYMGEHKQHLRRQTWSGKRAGNVLGPGLARQQEPIVLVLSRTPETCWGVVWGHLFLHWLRVDINPPKPQGIHGCTVPHQAAVNYPQTFLLDLNKAVDNTAGPAVLLTSTMLPSRTLHNLSKGRIWQDRKGEMQIFFL